MVDQRFGTKGCAFYTESLDVDQVIEKVNCLETERQKWLILKDWDSSRNSLRNPTMQLLIML